MVVADVASAIIEALTSGLTGLISQVPIAIKNAFEGMFLTTVGEGSSAVTSVSTFAVVSLIFGGIALAFGITKWATNAVSRKVGR